MSDGQDVFFLAWELDLLALGGVSQSCNDNTGIKLSSYLLNS